MMKSIILSTSLLLSLFLQGCYTQLAIFYPDPEIESSEEGQFYDTYKRAFPSMKGESYAQDGRAATPLAYSAMQRRVYSPYSGYYYGYNDDYYHSNPFYNGLNGYRYGYNGYNSYGYSSYLYTDDPVGYGSIIPMGDREKRKFTRDRSQGTPTMLYTTRSSNSTNDSNNTSSSSYSTNSSSVSSTRSSGSYSSSGSSTSRSSSSSSSSGGRRATRRE